MSVPVILECGSCQKRLQLDEKFLGKKVRCPICTMGIAVPTREEYINSGMAAKAVTMSGKRLSLNGLAKAMVELSDDADGYVIADAVQFLPSRSAGAQ